LSGGLYTTPDANSIYTTPDVSKNIHYNCCQEDYTLHMPSVGLYITPDVRRIIHYTRWL